MVTRLEFFVHGRPQPAGSKKAFVVNGRARIVDDAKGSRPWKQQIAGAAHAALAEVFGDELAPLLTGPLDVELHFTVARPAGHYGQGRNAGRLKPSAPAWPVVRPDVDKLSRATLDACTGTIWRDDAQVVRKTVTKSYGPREGVLVRVRSLLAPAVKEAV